MHARNYSAKALASLCIAFALFAFILIPAMFAVSASLSLRSNPTPVQSYLGKASHAIAFVCIAILPCLLTLIGSRYWMWTALYSVTSASIFLIAERIAPGSNNFWDIAMRRIGPTFFIPTFALMIASAAFGGIIRGSFINRKWLNFWGELLVYLVIALIAIGYLAIPLYVE